MKLAVVATVFLMSASAWAQDAPADTSQDQSGGEAAQKPESEYGGPAILSRGGLPSLLRKGDQARLTPFLTVTSIYDYFGPSINTRGQPLPEDGYGVFGSFGVTGSHNWERSTLSLDYHGSYRDYSNVPYYSGFDNSLSLGFTHQLTSRLGIMVSEDAARTHSTSSLPLGTLYNSGASGYNPVYSALAATSVLNTPTDASVTSARLIYQLSARLSVSVGGTGIIARQHAEQTLGANGYNAGTDLAYRLTRYQTVSFNYSFTHFGYIGGFGQTDIQGVGMGYSARLGRSWEVAANGGLSRVELNRTTTITLDPVLAQLLGESVVFEKMHNIFYMPFESLTLTRTFRRSSWSAGYNRSTTAGNGLYTTSGYDTVNSNYSYWGLRRLTLQAGAGYWQYSAMSQSLGRFRSYGGSGGFSCRIAKGISAVGRVDGRRYWVSNSSLDRTIFSATLGFSWSPGAYPVAIW